ncbi:MAG: tetratricopeptide repeat protein [candidate division Zixibacteria bacterium]|nr:tetratricopeptide repeat protein [candidate division Zixibacteria bacterium]
MRMKRLSAILIFILALTASGCLEEAKNTDNLSTEEEAALFKRASVAEAKQNYEVAIDLYITIADKCPDSPHRDKALFMAGFLKSENLGQKDEALKYFKELLKKYPDSDLSDDAGFMVEAIEAGQDALSTFNEKTSD